MQLASSRWLALILVGATALRLFPAWFGLPYLRARPDEEVAIATALNVLNGDLNPHFFHWPSLTFYLFAGVFALARAAGRASPAEYLVIGRVVIALVGVATVFITFRIGRRIAGEASGLIAAALLAVAMLHVRDSHFAMTDVLATFFVTASLSLILVGVDAAPSRALRWFAAAGCVAGLAASTKYNAAAVGAAMIAAQLLRWRGSWWPSVAYGLLFVAGFLVATPYAVLDYAAFKTDVLFDVTHLSGGHGIDLGRGWIYHLTHSLPFGLGPTTMAVAVVGMVPLWRKHRRAAWILGSVFVALYVVIGSGHTVFFRYILPLVPIACVSAAIGVREIAAWLASRTALAHERWLALVLVLTVGPGLVNSAWFDVLLARTDSRVLAGRWLEPRLQPEHTLYDAGGEYAKLDLARLRFHQWYEFDRATQSFGHPEGLKPDWLVLYESPVFTYARVPAELAALAGREYVLVKRVPAARRGGVYDLQDAFFMPVWGFWTVERPGPSVHIYMRRDLPARQTP